MLRGTRQRIVAALTAALLAIGTLGLGLAAPATAAPAPLTNLAHLDFLLDEVRRGGRLSTRRTGWPRSPTWSCRGPTPTPNDDGTFKRVGGGDFDAATGYCGQGAFNADDVTRTAVVYLRHWQQFGDDDSRQKAYELLRSVAYLQTATGPNAGNVVLWMQDDGT